MRRHARTRRVLVPLLLLALLAAWMLVLVIPTWQANRDERSSLSKGFRRHLAHVQPSGDEPYTILLVGTDESQPGREVGRADSISLLRIDPDSGDVAALSIPRNLAVRVPKGEAQVAHLMQAGGIPRIARVLHSQLGIEVHHVMHVDTRDLADIVDAVGGVQVDNPSAVRERWREHEWKFPKGKLELDGREALAFARLRTNELDEHESDSTRALRQQLVVSGIVDRLTSPTVILRPGAIAGVVGALRTDMTLPQLARAGLALHGAIGGDELVRCRLGGTFRGLQRHADEPTDVDPLAIARPGFQLGRPSSGVDPWLLEPAKANRSTVEAFLDARATKRVDRSNPDYPVGCS